jgi:hypothetical protein
MSFFKNIAKYSKSNKKMLDTALKAASKAAPKVTRTKKSMKKGMRKKGKTMSAIVALSPESLKVLQGKKLPTRRLPK